jgi:hypothetical protein
LPIGFRLTKYAGVTDGFAGKETYALEYGALLMGLVGSEVKNGVFNLPFPATELPAKLKPIAGPPLHFNIEGINGVEFVPYYEIQNEPFTCYPFFAPTK